MDPEEQPPLADNHPKLAATVGSPPGPIKLVAGARPASDAWRGNALRDPDPSDGLLERKVTDDMLTWQASGAKTAVIIRTGRLNKTTLTLVLMIRKHDWKNRVLLRFDGRVLEVVSRRGMP